MSAGPVARQKLRNTQTEHNQINIEVKPNSETAQILSSTLGFVLKILPLLETNHKSWWRLILILLALGLSINSVILSVRTQDPDAIIRWIIRQEQCSSSDKPCF